MASEATEITAFPIPRIVSRSGRNCAGSWTIDVVTLDVIERLDLRHLRRNATHLFVCD
jgi:hypothetical protein